MLQHISKKNIIKIERGFDKKVLFKFQEIENNHNNINDNNKIKEAIKN